MPRDRYRKKREGYKPRTPVTELKGKKELSVYSAANKASYLKTKTVVRKIYQQLQSAEIGTVDDTPKKADSTKTFAAVVADAAGDVEVADQSPSLSDVDRTFE